jgi:hypothetical protein
MPRPGQQTAIPGLHCPHALGGARFLLGEHRVYHTSVLTLSAGAGVVPYPFTDPPAGVHTGGRIALMLLVEPGSYKVSNGYIVLQSLL